MSTKPLKDLSALSDEDVELLSKGKFEKMSEDGLNAYNDAPDYEDPVTVKEDGMFPEIDAKLEAFKKRGWENLSPAERLGVYAMTIPKYGVEGLVKIFKGSPGMVMRSAPVIIGQKIGEASRVPGAPNALGAVGGVLGEIAADLYEGEDVTAGKLSGALLAGAVRGKNVVGLKSTTNEAVRQGAANVVADEAQTLVDTGEIKRPSAEAFGMGALAVGGQKALDTGARAERIAVRKADDIKAYKTVQTSAEHGFPITPRVATPSKFERATNAAVRRDLNLPSTARLGDRTYQIYLNELHAPHRQAAKLSPEAAFALSGMQEARAEARRLHKAYKASQGNRPDLLTEAEEMGKLSDAFENDLVKITRNAGKVELSEQIIASRPLAAKTYLAMRATNNARGVVNAKEYGKEGARNPRLLTGEAKVIADTFNAKQAREFQIGNLLSRPVTISMAVLDAIEHTKAGQSFSKNIPSWHQYPDIPADMTRFAIAREGRDAETPNIQDILKRFGQARSN